MNNFSWTYPTTEDSTTCLQSADRQEPVGKKQDLNTCLPVADATRLRIRQKGDLVKNCWQIANSQMWADMKVRNLRDADVGAFLFFHSLFLHKFLKMLTRKNRETPKKVSFMVPLLKLSPDLSPFSPWWKKKKKSLNLQRKEQHNCQLNILVETHSICSWGTEK